MSKIELKMPKMGESVAEATIISWKKNIGDFIQIDETVVEIATDKVDSEIPSSAKGKLLKKLFKENEVVKVGETIAIIDTEENQVKKTEENKPVSTSENEESLKIIKEEIEKAKIITEKPKDTRGQDEKFFSPLVKNIAKKEGIKLEELNKITGTGKESRVTKNDILHYLKTRTSHSTPSNIDFKNQDTAILKNIESGKEIIEMSRMRKLIADHMTMSKSVSAHVTSFNEVDMTKIVKWRKQIKEKFLSRESQNITFTPIIIEAIIKAIIDFPMINISVDGTKIIKHQNINIGMATALPDGNLIVPVIKSANEKSLLGITKSVNDLSDRARNGKLQPDETLDGTFTFTNVGTFGSIMGTPIINQPQVAILAAGMIQKNLQL